MKEFKVVACITAYEDTRAVEACMTAIKKQSFQVKQILIVDNSKTKSILFSAHDALIEHCPENSGVSGGLRLGLEWAFTNNYDFLWAFDQDSVPTFNCLEVLLKEYNQLFQVNYQIGIIAPTSIDLRTNRVVEGAVFDRDHFMSCKHKDQSQYYECESPITSGSLISIAAAKTISLPRADIFIDGVDFEYGMRLKQNGFYNLIVTRAILYHQFGSPIKVNFLQKERFVYKYSALRHYYICRNHTYLETRYSENWYRLTCCRRRIKYLCRTIIVILLYDHENKVLKILACLLGTYHGFKGKLGKVWH